MEANKGYMLCRKADAGTTSFRYPSTWGSMTAATRITGYNGMDQSRMAQDVETQYQDNMTMIAIPSGFELESNDRILDYASGELRGI